MANKTSRESLELLKEKVAQLRRLFPETVSEGKINFEKLRLTLGQDIARDESYSFNWAGRKDSFNNIQTTAKGTLTPDKKESVRFDTTENIFIEGDNLEVLKLLQKAYFNSIKMIYIDPPYNTGNDFVYHDDFKNSIRAYLQQTGQANGDNVLMTTNVETNGRFHSDWISMMYPRLFVARNILTEDGVMFVSIDDNEVHDLKIIMNEIFGEENFLSQIVWKKKYTGGKHAKHFVDLHEYILVYAKNREAVSEFLMERPEEEKEKFIYEDEYLDTRGKYYIRPLKSNLELRPTLIYPIKLPDGKNIETQWIVSKPRFEDLVKNGKILFKKKQDGEYQVYMKYYENENGGQVKIPSIIENTSNNEGKLELKEIFKVQEGREIPFDTVKPVNLIKPFIKSLTYDQDIILDFFAGSGTTAHAVLELNKEDGRTRKFILVQLPEKTDEKSAAYKQGYKTIAEITKERIRRIIKTIENEENGKLIKKNIDLGFKVFKLHKSNYKIWENYDGQDANKLKKQLELFKSSLINEYKELDVIYECIIKEGLSLNARIEEKKLKHNRVYAVSDNGQSFYICLDEKINADTYDELNLKEDDVFICLDEALNDSKKTNIAVQCNLKTL